MAEGVARIGNVLGWLIAGDLRQHPARIVTAVIAIATGVALGFAVHLVNASALTAFGQAVRSVNGTAELQVKAAGPLGLDEALYPKILAMPGVTDASPVVELNAIADRGARVTLLGLDVIRAANVTPSLIGLPSGSGTLGPDEMFADNALFASRATLAALGVKTGDSVSLTANGQRAQFVVRGELPGAGDEQRIAVIDIASAQWRFGRLGRIDRIDLDIADDAPPVTYAERFPPCFRRRHC